MSSTIPNASLMVPVTASSPDSDTIDIRNLFMFPDKRQALLNVCSSVGVLPVDTTADALTFKRQNKQAVLNALSSLNMKPIVTEDASVSGVNIVASALKAENQYTILSDISDTNPIKDPKRIEISLATNSGLVNTGLSIELQNMTTADAVRLVNVIKASILELNSPVDVTIFESTKTTAKTSVPNRQQMEKLHKCVGTIVGSDSQLNQFMMYMDNLPSPEGKEVQKVYAESLLLQFPDGNMVKIPVGTQVKASIIKQNDIFVGPNPACLPIAAGEAQYTVTDLTPDHVFFRVTSSNKFVGEYKLTRSQFDGLMSLYRASKSTTKAFNVLKREAFKKERRDSDEDQLKFLDGFRKNLEEQIPTKIVEPKVTKNRATHPPKGIAASTEGDNKLIRALGIW